MLPLSYAVDAMQHLTTSAATGEVWQRPRASSRASRWPALALGAATLRRRTAVSLSVLALEPCTAGAT